MTKMARPQDKGEPNTGAKPYIDEYEQVYPGRLAGEAPTVVPKESQT